MAQFMIDDILHFLDSQSVDGGFPAFSNCNIDMVTARLRGFQNENSWIIMFEQLVNYYPVQVYHPASDENQRTEFSFLLLLY